MSGDGIESGYIWYDESGNPYYLFAYPYELRRTGNTVDVTWDTGLTTTLQEFTDGVWRDFRYVAYSYVGDNTWVGDDGSSVTGMAPPQSEDDELDAGGLGGPGSDDTYEDAEDTVPENTDSGDGTDNGTDNGTDGQADAADDTEAAEAEESIVVE